MGRTKKETSSAKTETITVPCNQSLSVELKSDLINRTIVPVYRENILKLEKGCNLLRKNNSRFLRIVLPDIFLGLATTFLGVLLSGPLNQICFPDFRAYICYIVSPLLALCCIFGFIIIKVIYKIRDDNLLRMVEEYVLEPAGYGKKEE